MNLTLVRKARTISPPHKADCNGFLRQTAYYFPNAFFAILSTAGHLTGFEVLSVQCYCIGFTTEISCTVNMQTILPFTSLNISYDDKRFKRNIRILMHVTIHHSRRAVLLYMVGLPAHTRPIRTKIKYARQQSA
jgi:hypothetical protein